MRVKCKRCKSWLKVRKNWPFGRNAKPRKRLYCPRCSQRRSNIHEMKGGVV